MTNFDFISRKVFFICTVNGNGVTIKNTNYTTIDVELLSQAELAVIAKGIQFLEIECSDPYGFETYLLENSTEFDTGQAAPNATVISHNNLTNLNTDDHLQYHNDTRGDARYYRKIELTNGALDTRYYTKAEVDPYFAKGPLNQKSGFFEDFIAFSSATISRYLIRSLLGAGATTTFVTPESANDYRNGIMSFSSGITTTGAASAVSGFISLIHFANIPVGGYEEIAANIKIPILSDEANAFSVIVGFGDGTTALPVDGAYISISTDGATLNTRSNSITSSTTATAVSAATEYIAKVRVQNTDGTLTALGYLDGAPIGSLTTNIPSGSGRHTGIQVGIIKSAGTASRIVEVDWINYEAYRPRTINY